MNTNLESRARWYALKLILIYFSIITILIVIGYIDLFYMAVVLVTMFVIMVAGAIFSDAYYSKLLELEKNERTN